jgi:two-component system, LytTR family, sensor histidine kinase AgrC
MKKSRIKLVLFLSAALLLFFTSLNIYTSYKKIIRTVEESIANQTLEAAKSIAAEMDIAVYKRFLENPAKNEHYWEIRNYLNDAREKLGALYVYTLNVDNPVVSTTEIVGYPPQNFAEREDFPIGEVCTVPEEQVNIAYYKQKPFVTDIIKDPKYGTYLTVGAPIKNEAGEVISYLGIDISVNTVNDIKGQVLKNNLSLFIFNGVFIIVVITSFLFMQRWYQREVQKEVGYTEDTYQAEIKTLIASVSSLRHDFTNHIQVVHGLLQIGASKQAQEYLASLDKEVQSIEVIKLGIDHPGLLILLQTKKLTAQNHGIDMDISVSATSFSYIKTTDLIKILSNLIDNAIDAAKEFPEEKRRIEFHCEADEERYIFKIINTGPAIIRDAPVFKKGFTTKEAQDGKRRGQGLFIVKEVVGKYGGKISIYPTGEFETTAIVEIPIK